ncbi:hypothetical protein BC938DRAFT_480371 [Jimgerdemannia flammicorona]|uniref:Uncharacterized protein n=1 Tax=Jimgerdemannia flammicorona TaxID=994334 RepID=A0A433QIN2_9FUNG|nr:hypothetical protein BC938DRAFT_480371 [Jimgerdemannia flammicorona]
MRVECRYQFAVGTRGRDGPTTIVLRHTNPGYFLWDRPKTIGSAQTDHFLKPDILNNLTTCTTRPYDTPVESAPPHYRHPLWLDSPDPRTGCTTAAARAARSRHPSANIARCAWHGRLFYHGSARWRLTLQNAPYEKR